MEIGQPNKSAGHFHRVNNQIKGRISMGIVSRIILSQFDTNEYVSKYI